MTETFVQELTGIQKLCGHFHLSLQSGSDETLRRMNRHYTTAEYLEGVKRLRTYFSHPAITTDVIAGFPGETESEFDETRKFIRQIGFYELHVFSYSVRQGTRAAEMKDQISDMVRKKRSEELLQIAEKQSHLYRESMLSRPAEVLLEEEKSINGEKYQVGYSPEYIRCAIQAGENIRHGEIVTGTLKYFLERDLILLDRGQF
jgi:threonylcarbamoyladenosine tRNA methylthiotransferase MtaB